MIVTEDEAKTKRCHQSMGFEKQPAYPSHCMGSACMAWRWLDSVEYRDEPRAGNRLQGYCGKAGRP